MSTWDRIGSISGLIGWVMVFASVSLAEVGDPTDPSEALVSDFIANRDRVRLGAELGLLAAFLLLVWVAFLYPRFRETEGPFGWF